ncbi:molybdopterin-dependent oxidoreductase [Pantoea agglomerans]|uniref:molybdopterin-dependent oxidoreductase n=1 Tax=Enterobacter agglomerans TaxID=549 RepID=UPI000DAB601F|nr:molybdopterin-dependent oxidoreductase [Pantoea agglomerans]RAH31443.1 Asp-tRNA(Asn)/Glu-tRNA(Gln) amidotransferase GatCAB subunit C [Pantoea agglomerans]TGX92523.1 Asp-tRNA(Asn)/Glu-tRNA(Gln) amidotransferase GatCAB subunit C [Pantoea agglomerans]
MKKNDLAVMHWGTYHVTTDGDTLTSVRPVAWDRNPSAIGQSLPGAVQSETRVKNPAVRLGYLQNRSASRNGRGKEPFVEVSWDVALQLVAEELERVKTEHGNQAIYAGSYGWSSAGRFHHAQSQLHRFFNHYGGYTASTNTYSIAAGERTLPHIIGNLDELQRHHTHWPVLAEHCELFVAIGGLPLRNAQVNGGGANDHALSHWLTTLRQNGTRFINISPVRNDLAGVADSKWLAIQPGSDTALLLAIGQVLITESLYDAPFTERYTVGFDHYAAYLLGERDGIAKTPEWAAPLTGLAAAEIRALARQMAAHKTMVNIAWSVQRARQGEQAFWATVATSALLGQIGTPGGGLGFGYASTNLAGAARRQFSGPRLPAGHNPVQETIPVARIADMLLNPGGHYEFDGQQRVYPDIRLVYWAGGNVFHHHQDINKLIRAWQRPDTVIVHEQFWTAQAKFADIVLPATTSLEREDIGSASNDGFIIAMPQHLPPFAAAKSDYAIFAALSQRLGFADAFTQGRDERQWLQSLYEDSRPRAAAQGIGLPPFEAFWSQGVVEYPAPETPQILLKAFRDNPESAPLSTPSGKIELFSQQVADFGYDEAPGFACWYAPEYQAQQQEKQQWPLHLLSSQPRTRLHSQYDHGRVSRATKIAGREPLWMHPEDAAARGIEENSIVKVFNGRGALLAGVHLTQDILPGVVQMSTGAWYDPLDQQEGQPLDKHGNPNVLTQDSGSSRLGQGCSAQTCFVEIALYQQPLPEITAWLPPAFVAWSAE